MFTKRQYFARVKPPWSHLKTELDYKCGRTSLVPGSIKIKEAGGELIFPTVSGDNHLDSFSLEGNTIDPIIRKRFIKTYQFQTVPNISIDSRHHPLKGDIYSKILTKVFSEVLTTEDIHKSTPIKDDRRKQGSIILLNFKGGQRPCLVVSSNRYNWLQIYGDRKNGFQPRNLLVVIKAMIYEPGDEELNDCLWIHTLPNGVKWSFDFSVIRTINAPSRMAGRYSFLDQLQPQETIDIVNKIRLIMKESSL